MSISLRLFFFLFLFFLFKFSSGHFYSFQIILPLLVKLSRFLSFPALRLSPSSLSSENFVSPRFSHFFKLSFRNFFVRLSRLFVFFIFFSQIIFLFLKFGSCHVSLVFSNCFLSQLVSLFRLFLSVSSQNFFWLRLVYSNYSYSYLIFFCTSLAF